VQGKTAAAEHTDQESTAGSPRVVEAVAVHAVLVHADLAASKEDERGLHAEGSRLVAAEGSSQDRG
jgi:hypothetical protein